MTLLQSRAASFLGIALTRVVVPLWVVTGATFKLAAATPKLLPRNIWTTAHDSGIDLYWLLAILIGLELLAAGIMILVAPLARAMAVFMLGAFCLVLVGEIVAGNTDCGCLGAASPPIWAMLSIDGGLLLGVMLFRPRYGERPRLGTGHVLATSAWIVAGFAIAGAVVLPERGRSAEGATDPVPVAVNPGGGDGGAVTPPVSPPARPGQKPPSYYVPECGTWVGQPFRQIDLARYMKAWPEDLEQGRRYIIFYSPTCDHCQEMLETHFYDQPPAPTLLVAIPETKQGFDRAGELDMFFCRECVEMSALPIGTDWLITPPIVVALEDGIVRCAQEGGDEAIPPEECLIFH